eukprot:TRINITY_DN232_c0_g1_i1.p1 TRINITY_DN232_c0_g1~~TRINITY_DN232_c0_g1_i1.p1  ORF type:complete len:183 (-),score=46.41 TRINITY_DN232_c0_g1_i1:325-873(-)
MVKQRKICVMGYRGVGKSSVTIRFAEEHFVDTYNPTIENTFQKNLKLRGEEYDLTIVDTAGQDDYSIFQPRHSVGVHGFVLVYSVTSKTSLEMVKAINEKILNATGTERVPRVLVGNKNDLEYERQVSIEEGQKLAKDWGCSFLETSAKHNENITKIFQMCLDDIEKSLNPQPPSRGGCLIV